MVFSLIISSDQSLPWFSLVEVALGTGVGVKREVVVGLGTLLGIIVDVGRRVIGSLSALFLVFGSDKRILKNTARTIKLAPNIFQFFERNERIIVKINKDIPIRISTRKKMIIKFDALEKLPETDWITK